MKVFIKKYPKTNYAQSFVVLTSLVFASSLYASRAPDQIENSKYLAQAHEILSKYGGNDGLLDKSEMTKMVADKEFEGIDTNEDGRIEYAEYLDAFLFCNSSDKNDDAAEWVCNDEIENRKNPAHDKFKLERDAAKDKRLTSYELYTNNYFWETKINRAVDSQWAKATAKGCSEYLTDFCLSEYLKSTDEESLFPVSAEKRLEELTKDSHPGMVAQKDYDDLRKTEIFKEIDSDKSDSIDILEVKNRFGKQVIDYFLTPKTQRTGLFMSEEQFKNLDLSSNLGVMVEDEFIAEWENISDGTAELQKESLVKARLEKEEKDAREVREKQNATKLLGGTWIKGRGLLLEGERLYDPKAKSESLNWEKPALTMKFVKNVTNAGSKAEPGKFSWVKDDGEDSVYGLEFAFRFDYYNPDWYDLTDKTFLPALGFEINKSGTGDNKKDEHRFYILGDLFVNHGWNFLGASHFQIGPYLEFDSENDDDKVTGLIEWEPILNIFGFNTGVYYPLGGSSNFTFFLRPIAALEADSYLNTSDNSDAEDNTYLRYGVHTGLKFFKQFEISYTARQRHIIDDLNNDFFYNEASARWTPDSNEWIYFEFGYKRGKEAPSDNSIEQYSSGIGVKF